MISYERMLEKSKEARVLGTVGSAINWDYETYMPPRGLAQRSEQLALLGRIIHRTMTSPKIGEIITEIEKTHETLDDIQKRNFFLFRKDYREATQIPEDLVAELAKQNTIAIDAWKRAKAAKDWTMFKPELEKSLELVTRRYELLMETKEAKTMYDAMIDDFEPGMNQDIISKVFQELRNGLVPLAKRCAEASSSVDFSFLSKRVPAEIQRKIANEIADFLEYDISSNQAGGRIDEAEHPFTTGYYDDVRITVNYHEDNVSSAIYATLHEVGHALYEQNLNPEWKYQPIGQSSSAGIHESMARFLENMIGRTSEFLQYFLPKLNNLTTLAFAGIEIDDFVRAVNIVQPSKIRIEADEITYSLHIIIRFEIERDLIAGKITVDELPSVWNEKYAEYLGVDINDDSEGVLQDIHWSAHLFGYFPSYALGNVYDGMWLEKINQDIPNWQSNISEGQFGEIKRWLVDNIHVKSGLYDPRDLAMDVVGSDLTAKPFLDYAEKKYSALFGF